MVQLRSVLSDSLEFVAEPVVEQRLFVANRVIAKGHRDFHHEREVAQIAAAFLDDVAFRIRQTKRELDARRINVFHDSNIVESLRLADGADAAAADLIVGSES